MLTSSYITPKVFNEQKYGKFKYVSPIAWSDQKIRTENGERERERERERQRQRETEREREREREVNIIHMKTVQKLCKYLINLSEPNFLFDFSD